MNIAYFITALNLTADGTAVMVSLRSAAGDVATVSLPSGSPAIAQLTIGRQVDAVFTAV